MSPMISYAQNGEDVRLRRAFPEPTMGFYVEVGAFDPAKLSITKHFYDRGWRGITVEPSPAQFERIRQARPRDIALNVALSDHDGEQVFHESIGEGLSTLESREADNFRRKGFANRSYPVKLRTLRSVCEEHVRGPIDFLTVDVEGHEKEVLLGGDFRTFRPKIAIIEATRPQTSVPTHDQWESILLDADYRLAAFDGVSRYYVAAECADLGEKIAAPPSALDDYIIEDHFKALERLRQLHRSVIAAPAVHADDLVRAVLARIRQRLRRG